MIGRRLRLGAGQRAEGGRDRGWGVPGEGDIGAAPVDIVLPLALAGFDNLC
jgi:hypothetical protein